MANADMQRHAEHFLRVVSGYPYLVSAGLTGIYDTEALLTLELAVELPNAARLSGQSDNGVRAVERVEVVLHDDYTQPGSREVSDAAGNELHRLLVEGERIGRPLIGQIEEDAGSRGDERPRYPPKDLWQLHVGFPTRRGRRGTLVGETDMRLDVALELLPDRASTGERHQGQRSAARGTRASQEGQINSRASGRFMGLFLPSLNRRPHIAALVQAVPG